MQKLMLAHTSFTAFKRKTRRHIRLPLPWKFLAVQGVYAAKCVCTHGRLLKDPQFIVALTVAQVILNTVIKLLQAKDCNIADAYHDVALAKECIRDARKGPSTSQLWNLVLKACNLIEPMQPGNRME